MQRKIRFRTIGIVLTAVLCLNPVYGQKKKRDKKSNSEGVFLLQKEEIDGLEFWKSIASFVKKHTINEKGQFLDIHTSMKGDIKNLSIMGKSLIINTYYTKGQTIGNEYIYITVIRRESILLENILK